jgi:hypothetical protein
MFLPVLLIHRYGWIGFFIFSIPNIIGCSAFGYVIRTPERSKALVEKYKSAITLFAIVTIAFHLFFISMISLVYLSDGYNMISLWLPVCILVLCTLLAFVPTKIWPILAACLWIFSVIAGLSFLPFNEVPSGELPWQDAVWLLPITTFGFFLSPYLDPTFHRALQNSPSKHSFGVFGLAFTVMIVITTLYVGIAPANLDSTLFVFGTLLGLHLLLQSMFTIGAHMKEGLRLERGKRKSIFIAILVVACFIAIAFAHRLGGVSPSGNWLPNWQDDYIRFFVFYGLIFPAIVAAFMLTGKPFTPIRVTLFVLAALLSLPLLEVGYLGDQAWLSVLPVVVFLTWAFADRKSLS